jgi:hypothetical protein
VKLHLLNPKVAVAHASAESARTLGVSERTFTVEERPGRERAKDDRGGGASNG